MTDRYTDNVQKRLESFARTHAGPADYYCATHDKLYRAGYRCYEGKVKPDHSRPSRFACEYKLVSRE